MADPPSVPRALPSDPRRLLAEAELTLVLILGEERSSILAALQHAGAMPDLPMALATGFADLAEELETALIAWDQAVAVSQRTAPIRLAEAQSVVAEHALAEAQRTVAGRLAAEPEPSA